jgi:regulator of replication initiation timing
MRTNLNSTLDSIMERDLENEAGYVQKVREDTRRYMSDLLNEIDSIRQKLIETLEHNCHLRKQVSYLESELATHRTKEDSLHQELSRIEEARRRYCEQYLQVEEQNNDLANLYVASHRLHQAFSREEVLSIIQEILVNLLGSEEIGVFELNGDDSALSLAASLGIDDARYRSVRLGDGLIGEAALSGETYISDCRQNEIAASETGITACIPLKLNGKVTGVIAVFRLLGHKPALRAVDYELLELLATHAATALYCSRLYSGAAA